MNCSEKGKRRKVKISLNKSIFFCSNISQTSPDKNNLAKLRRIFAQNKFKWDYVDKVHSRFSRDGKMDFFTSQTRPLRRENSQRRQPEVIPAVVSFPLAVAEVCRRRILSSLIWKTGKGKPTGFAFMSCSLYRRILSCFRWHLYGIETILARLLNKHFL